MQQPQWLRKHKNCSTCTCTLGLLTTDHSGEVLLGDMGQEGAEVSQNMLVQGHQPGEHTHTHTHTHTTNRMT